MDRVRGLEHLPPVSTPFRRFLSRLTCWAPAQRRSLGAKITRKLPAHRCFAVFTEQNWAEARRRPQGILSYFQGLERSISPILPAKTDRGSSPLTLRKETKKHPSGGRVLLRMAAGSRGTEHRRRKLPNLLFTGAAVCRRQRLSIIWRPADRRRRPPAKRRQIRSSPAACPPPRGSWNRCRNRR